MQNKTVKLGEIVLN